MARAELGGNHANCWAFIQKDSSYFRGESLFCSTCFKEVGSSSIRKLVSANLIWLWIWIDISPEWFVSKQ